MLRSPYQSIEHYAATLRKKKSVSVKALGSVDLAAQHSEMVSKVSKSWWAKQSPEERAARGKRAAAGRWGKKASPKKDDQKKS